MRRLPIQPLDAAAFAPFGAVIELEGAQHYPINAGTTERFHALALTDTAGEGGQTGISLFRGQGFALPYRLRLMERHPRSSQAFIPLSSTPDARYLVVVAPPGELRLERLEAFLARGFQGVQYARGVWHHPLIALDCSSDFIVVDRIADDANCDEVALTDEILATLPGSPD